MTPYSELIRVLQESASDLVEHQRTRNRQRFLYERHKLILLITLLLSLWVMFFLLWEKLDEKPPAAAAPTPSPTYVL
jgi:hypothetical protein